MEKMLSRGRLNHGKAVTLRPKNSLFNGENTLSRRRIQCNAGKGFVRFHFGQDGIYGSQHHPADGNDSFFVATPLLESEIPLPDLRVFLGTNDCLSALNKQGLDVNTSPADASSFLFAAAFVILRN